METGRPVTQSCNETTEEMRNLIEQINMRFQVVELNMNLMLSPINANFAKIFNQLDTLFDKVGKLEEQVNRYVNTGMKEIEDPNSVGKELTQKITPLLQIIKEQAQEKTQENQKGKEIQEAHKSPVSDQPSTSNQPVNPKKPRQNYHLVTQCLSLQNILLILRNLSITLTIFPLKLQKSNIYPIIPSIKPLSTKEHHQML